MIENNEFDRICQIGRISGPVSVDEVRGAENQLNVVFPDEYILFLRKYGSVLCNGFEIYGLPKFENSKLSLWQSVIHVTMELRRIGQVGADRLNLIPVSDDGTGIYFFIDTSVSPRTEIWAIGPGIEKKMSENFYDFFTRLFYNELQY